MRRLPLLLILVLLISIGYLLVPRDRADGPRVPAEPADDVAIAPQPAELEAATGEPEPSPREPAPASTRSAAAPAEAPDGDVAAASCVVLGSVVDEAGLPLAGVRIQLKASRVWTAGLDVPRLAGRYDHRGFETETDSAGAFRFEAPVPTNANAMLAVEPGPYHDSTTLYFGYDRPSSRPRLMEGVNDLGELKLATTGALSGRVTDANGAPLADVELDVEPGRNKTYSGRARTEEDGTYVLGHAPVGTYMAKARLEGYLSAFVEPVTVEARRETTGVDFVLQAAGSIRGTVVDERGRPLENVLLHSLPAGSGSGASAYSAANGSFTVFLPQAESYTLSASRDGYGTWGDESDNTKLFAPGTEGLQIVLHAVAKTRFLVVDAETGEPLERFGLTILEDNGSKSPRMLWTERRRPRLRDRPGGIAELTARPAIDAYLVAAEGYLLASGDVEPDSAPDLQQTIRLERGALVRGRLLLDGEPVPGADVELAGATPDYERTPGGGFALADPPRYSIEEHDLRRARTDVEGRFELAGIAPRTYRLTATPPQGAPLVVLPLEVSTEPEQDLGDLALLPGAHVTGRLLLPAWVEPAGLLVHLDDLRAGVTAVADAAGGFRFEDLAPGSHSLELDERPGELAASEAVPVELVSGENPLVTLDARDRAVCRVKLTVDLDGLSTENLEVSLISTANWREQSNLGRCDADGVVAGFVRGWGEARVMVYTSPVRRSLMHPEIRLQLEPGGSVEADVRFRFARLALRLPPGVTFPRDGTVQVSLQPALEREWGQSLSLDFKADALTTYGVPFARFQDGTLSLGVLLPGPHRLTLRLVDAAAELELIPVGAGSFHYQKPAYYEGTTDVELVAGEEQVVVLQ